MSENGARARAKKVVLVGVLKNRRDLNILLRKRWYRIPAIYVPARGFEYLAFYEPLAVGRLGKRIRYYARVLSRERIKRGDLLPDEPNHPRARNDYFKFRIGKPKKLPRPIRNIVPRRVSFGFAALDHLLESKNILQLYNIAPTEGIVHRGLQRAGIKANPQFYVSAKGERFRLDFAVFCARGRIAIECDNQKAHSGRRAREKDKAKDTALRRAGWRVLRLREKDVVERLNWCVRKVRQAIRALGGQKA